MVLSHRVLDGIALSLAEDPSSNTAWHQLALEGSWEGHWMGAFSLDSACLNQIANHQKNVKKVPIVCDYEHASLFAKNQAVPASGWLVETKVEPLSDGKAALFGKIEWTAKAADHIRNKEYRFLSPTINFKTRDRVNAADLGASLHSVALTNTPFLEELPEVRLNSLRSILTEDIEGESMEQLKELAVLFGLSESASLDSIKTRYNQLSDAHLAACKQLGLSSTVSKEEMVGAILKLQNPANTVALSDYIALKDQLAQRDAHDMVAAAQRDGKITADGTDLHKWALETAVKAPEVFRSWVCSAPKMVDLEIKKPAEKEAKSALSDDELKACKAAGISADDYIKYNR